MTFKGANHYFKEFDFLKLTALNVGYKVIILRNHLQYFKLIDGSTGIVKEIMFDHTN